MDANELKAIAQAMVANGKGILAADESFSTANMRFEKLGIPQTEEMRRAYREMLFTATGVGKFLVASFYLMKPFVSLRKLVFRSRRC